MGNSLSWFPAATPLTLSGNELHVWRASLDLSPAVRERFQDTLNLDEKKRAERFLIPEARERFVAARGILRELLGAYIGVEARRVGLTYGAEGKPSLAPEHNSKVCFNLSHSHGMGLFAFAKDHEVGADIEHIKKEIRGIDIASHFFSKDEIAALTELPPNRVDEAFFGCWTRKEAYVKAHGQGLSFPLRNFTVEFSKQIQVLQDEAGVSWSCYAVEAAPGFACAVVAEGKNWSLKYREWSAGLKSVAVAPLPD
jgi:4'-phosphopantetheinyl transferase